MKLENTIKTNKSSSNYQFIASWSIVINFNVIVLVVVVAAVCCQYFSAKRIFRPYNYITSSPTCKLVMKRGEHTHTHTHITRLLTNRHTQTNTKHTRDSVLYNWFDNIFCHQTGTT